MPDRVQDLVYIPFSDLHRQSIHFGRVSASLFGRSQRLTGFEIKMLSLPANILVREDCKQECLPELQSVAKTILQRPNAPDVGTRNNRDGS